MISKIVSVLERTIDSLNHQLLSYKDLKSGLMQDLLTGRVPVEALLESEPA